MHREMDTSSLLQWADSMGNEELAGHGLRHVRSERAKIMQMCATRHAVAKHVACKHVAVIDGKSYPVSSTDNIGLSVSGAMDAEVDALVLDDGSVVLRRVASEAELAPRAPADEADPIIAGNELWHETGLFTPLFDCFDDELRKPGTHKLLVFF